MEKPYPILILLPHGGYAVPEELAGLEAMNEFDLFFEADTCANDLFRFGDNVCATMDTGISRFFVDLDRIYTDIAASAHDGVIKGQTLFCRDTFKHGMFPDEIAIANILKRHYFPYHGTADKIIATGEVKLVLECHTVMPVGPPLSTDAGAPRPTITIENQYETGRGNMITCSEEIAQHLLESLKKQLAEEDHAVTPSCIKKAQPRSFMIKKYGAGGVPYLRLSISKALFLNDTYFNYDYLKVDSLRIQELNDLLWKGIERWFVKNF